MVTTLHFPGYIRVMYTLLIMQKHAIADIQTVVLCGRHYTKSFTILHLIFTTTLWAKYSIISTLQEESTLDEETQECLCSCTRSPSGYEPSLIVGCLTVLCLGDAKRSKIQSVPQGVYSSVGAIEKSTYIYNAIPQ